MVLLADSLALQQHLHMNFSLKKKTYTPSVVKSLFGKTQLHLIQNRNYGYNFIKECGTERATLNSIF